MEHGDRVKAELKILTNNRNLLLSLGHEVMTSANGTLYPLDFVVIGIVKRSVSIASAFKTLITDWNMVCARAILRMQIDTVIRFSAFWISEDSHKMAMKVMSGIQINRIKDKDGNRMTDAYLVKKLSSKFDWMPQVYKYTSGYIHFSERHLFDPIANLDEANHIISFIINEEDQKFPESSWHEIISCFNQCTEIIMSYLKQYKEIKEIEHRKVKNA
jgi:hypothetical protein